MEYLTLNNGNKIPLLGYGTYRVTNSIEGRKMVKNAIDVGYRLIDTAKAYGNEEEVGLGIKDSGIDRKELFLTTKVWFSDFEKGECKRSVSESLKKLDTDYLDLVLLHWPFGNVYAAWRDLEELYKEGVVKNIGISNFNPDRFIDLALFNEVVPCINQVEIHLYSQRKEHRTWMKKYGITPQAYAPLGKGKFNEIFTLPEVEKIAEKYGKTTAQIMLRFLTQEGVSVIPKSQHKERIVENFNIFDITLDESDLEILRGLDRNSPIEGVPHHPWKVETMKNRVLFQG